MQKFKITIDRYTYAEPLVFELDVANADESSNDSAYVSGVWQWLNVNGFVVKVEADANTKE